MQALRRILEGTYTLRIIENFLDLFLAVLPLLAISIVINVAAMQWVRGRRITFLHRAGPSAIPLAALVGVISPLPTYAAIPIGLSLNLAGLPFPAVLAFVVASPLMNPSIFFLTAAQLGLPMALARTGAALFLGLAAGVGAAWLAVEPTPGSQPASSAIVPDRSLPREIRGSVLHSLKFFSMAILLAAAVKALVPAQFVADLFGPNARMGTLAAVALGVPLYTCGGAAIPLVATLMQMGMGKGATLGFFIAGPATKIETLYAFRKGLGGRVLALYLLVTICGALFLGFLYEHF